MRRCDDADDLLKKVIALSPYSDLAEQAKTARTLIADVGMRHKADGQLRMDAVMYCLAAVEKFQAIGPQKKPGRHI